MVPGHTAFQVEIKKIKFETSEGMVFPKTAIVHFQLEGQETPQVELMGYLDEKEIYNAIEREEVINLDQCYVEKFSLRDYRLTRSLDARARVTLKGFTARNALFSGLSSLDFSYAVIEGEQFSLEGSWISRGDVLFEAARFKTDLTSFHGTRFPDGYFNFKNVVSESSETTFKNCQFGVGEKDFQYASFGRGNLLFVNADFSSGDVNFINTDFGRGDTSFKIARFGTGKVDFHFATFKDGNATFERTEFGDGRVDFRTVEFGTGRVNFNRAQFGDGEVSFDECEKEGGRFNFKRASFGSGDVSFEQMIFEHVEVNFERTHFGDGRVSFYRSWFQTLTLKFCQLNGFVDLRVNKCMELDLSSTIVRDIIDLNPYEFSAEIGTLNMAGMRLIGRIYLDWKKGKVKRMISSQSGSSHRVRSEQYRILKENFKNLGHYNDEDKAYVEFKREESKADLQESVKSNRWNGLVQYPVYYFKLGLFDKAGLYATSPVRVLITMLTFYVFFSLLYFIEVTYSAADIIASVDDQLTVLARSFYHSAITFLTIGYGDHYPFGAIRWVSSIEGFFGLFLMSYFTVAFVRKVLR